MLFLEKLLLTVRPEDRRDLLSQWERMVANEGQARTGKDVFKTGKWDRLGDIRKPEP